MPLPPTRYIDAGPGVPQASASAAMMQGEAMARLGNTIAQVGEAGFRIAERLRQVDEAGKLSALYANMEEDAAQFSMELMRREDTEAWPAEWKERSQKWKEEARNKGLSNEALAKFDLRYTDWNTQRSIGFEALAANKSLELGRARISNSMKYHAAHENWDAYAADLDLARDSGIISSPEHESGLMDMEQKRAAVDLENAVRENPGSIVGADEETLVYQFPGSTPEMVRYAKQEAGKQEARLAADTARAIEDEIYSDTPPTPGGLEKDPRIQALKAGGQAKLAESLKRELAARYNDTAQAMRKSPSYQANLMGKVSKDIADLNATDEMAIYKVESLLRQMEAGPMKNHLSAELARRINGEPEDASPVGMNLRLVDEAFKNDFFNQAKPGEPTRVSQLINEGFLSENNLKAAGFDDDQVVKILKGDGKREQTNKKRMENMRNLWKSRADKKALERLRAKDGFKAATFEAMVAEETEVTYKSDEVKGAEGAAKWKAAVEYAKTKKQLLEWSKANPKKAEDVDAVRGELLRIIGPTRDDDFIDSAMGGFDDESGMVPPLNAPLMEPLDIPFLND